MRKSSCSKGFLHVLRHFGTTLLMYGVLLSIELEKLLHGLNELVLPIVRMLHLERFEAWLRRRDLDFVFGTLLLVGDGFFEFKEYEARLIFLDHRVVFGLFLGLLFKVTYVTLANHLLHVFSGQLLRVGWIIWLYENYLVLRGWAIDWLHTRQWYVRARRYHEYSHLALAKRSAPRHECRFFT